MLFEGDLGPMVADGVEVQVEPGLARIEPDFPAASGQAFEQGDVGGPFHPVGVAGEVGGFGDSGQADRQAETGISTQGEGVGSPALSAGLDQQQRGEGLERGEHRGARVTGVGYQRVDAELDEGGQQHEEPGVVAFVAGTGRPLPDRFSPHRAEPRGGAGVAASQAFDAFGVEDGPHRLG
ncbi:MAG: hypothetical protein B7X07_07305 [Actinobacteria bacterium 21-64-8]|nr:MAG: hypothetical protein B7X07_07305 [Actinobacteria bacterium 21-64-8]